MLPLVMTEIGAAPGVRPFDAAGFVEEEVVDALFGKKKLCAELDQ